MQPRIVTRFAGLVFALAGCGASAAAPTTTPADARDPDHDTVLAADDFCPSSAEDLDRCNDEDGCPDPDDDGDGVLDAQDRCPDVAAQTHDGCPASASVVVTESDECFIMLESFYFDRGSAEPHVGSGALLDAFAAYLRRCPDILRLGIRGRADDGELPADLPIARATMIRDQLITRGVDTRRLVVDPPDTEPLRSEAPEGSTRSVSFTVHRSLHCAR